MRTVIAKVKIELPDDYMINEPDWVLEDAFINRYYWEVTELTEKSNNQIPNAEG